MALSSDVSQALTTAFDPATATLNDWLQWQAQLHSDEIELGLSRVAIVATRMSVLRPAGFVISIAGTNGKGSSAALIEQTLLNAGYRVGVYSSPHLLRYNERIRINGIVASDAILCAAFRSVEKARQDTSLTYFEYGTLAAFQVFIDARLDFAILEVGLGGRLDAVNVIDADLALITNIGLDHQDWLGEDREQIALEKAGIMRKGQPVIYNDPEPTDNIVAHARQLGARLFTLGREYSYVQHETSWAWHSLPKNEAVTDLPLPAMSGQQFVENAAAVIELLMQLPSRYVWLLDDFKQALLHWSLPGRCEWFSADNRGVKFPVLVDVAHNSEAVKQTVVELVSSKKKTAHTGRTVALYAALSDKPVAQILTLMAPTVDAWYFADLSDVPRGQSSANLLAEAKKKGIDGLAFASVERAWRQLCNDMGSTDRAVAFGSFYTVESVLRALTRPKTDT